MPIFYHLTLAINQSMKLCKVFVHVTFHGVVLGLCFQPEMPAPLVFRDQFSKIPDSHYTLRYAKD